MLQKKREHCTVSRRGFLKTGAQALSAVAGGTLLAGCGGGGGAEPSAAPVANLAPAVTSFSPSAEASGKVVVITGSNFDSSASVSFGGVRATRFSVDSSTQISATVPPAAGSGPLVVTTSGGSAQSSASLSVLSAPAPAVGYQLAWHDEFDGNSLGAAWNAGTAVRDGATQSVRAVTVANSVLTISTFTDAATGTHYTGFLNTKNLREFTYGYIEARLRFVNSPGQWSAFWLQSSGNKAQTPPNPAAGAEIDIIEHRAVTASATDISKRFVSNLHWNGYAAGQEQSVGSALMALPAGQAFSDWHTMGLLWTASGYQVYLDGVLAWSATTGVSQSNEYILLTSEVRGNDWAGNIPAGGYGAQGADANPLMQVDWVRLWQA